MLGKSHSSMMPCLRPSSTPRPRSDQIVNAMLDAEADEIANSARYVRSSDRKAFRTGHYERNLTTRVS